MTAVSSTGAGHAPCAPTHCHRLPRSPFLPPSLLLCCCCSSHQKRGRKGHRILLAPGHTSTAQSPRPDQQEQAAFPLEHPRNHHRRLPLPPLLPFTSHSIPVLETAACHPHEAPPAVPGDRARGRDEIGRRAMAAPGGGLDQDRGRGRGQDAAIKLFGRSIPVLHSSVVAAAASEVSSRSPSSRNHSLDDEGWTGFFSFSVDGVLAGGGAGWSLPAVSGKKRKRTGKRNRMRFFSPPCFCAVKCVLVDHGSCGDSDRCCCQTILPFGALFDSIPHPKKKSLRVYVFG